MHRQPLAPVFITSKAEVQGSSSLVGFETWIFLIFIVTAACQTLLWAIWPRRTCGHDFPLQHTGPFHSLFVFCPMPLFGCDNIAMQKRDETLSRASLFVFCCETGASFSFEGLGDGVKCKILQIKCGTLTNDKVSVNCHMKPGYDGPHGEHPR